MKLFQARTGFFFLWNYGLWWLELPITRTHFDSPFEFEPQKFYCIYILIIYICNLYLSIYTLVDNKRLKKHHGLLIFNVYLYPRTTDQLDFSLLNKWTVWLNVSPQKATNEKCKQMNKWGWKYKQINDRCCYLLAIVHVFWTVSIVQRIACLHWVQYIVDAITDRVKDYETDICMRWVESNRRANSCGLPYLRDEWRIIIGAWSDVGYRRWLSMAFVGRSVPLYGVVFYCSCYHEQCHNLV